MDLYQFLSLIMNLSILVFVVTSMLVMGLSLTITQIMAPLRNTRLVILALAVNFILVPAAAYLITAIFPLSDGLKIGLILVSTAAGAPFLPRLLQGISVDPWSIARPLILLMLIPLAIGLFIKARYAGIAGALHPYMARASTIALILVIAAGLLANLNALLGVFRSGAIIPLLLFLALAFVFGYFLGGRDGSIRSVLGLGAAQRNLSAALVVTTANFAEDPDVILTVLVLGLVGLVTLIITANLLGRRKSDHQPS